MANWKKVIVSGSQAELNSLALDTALTVANGGTGASTLTDGGVLLGSGTGAITATSVLTNGQLIIGDGTGDPTVSTLTAGTGVTITNGAGSIEISAAGSGGTVTSVGITGTDGIDVDSGSPITGAGTITLGLSNIANDKLANSTVSYGGVSLALGGTDATPAFNLTDATSLPLTSGVTGVLPIANGGTNISSYTTGDILYASSGTALAKLAIGTSGQILAVSSGGIVEWIDNDEGDITSVANTTNGGLTVTNGTGPDVTLTLNLNDLSAASVDVSTDSIAIIDANDSNGSRKESIADLATAMAGSGITATNGVLSATTGDVESVANATNGGMDVTNGSGPDVTIAMDINNLSAASIASGDFIAFSDEGTAGDPTKKESIDDVATLFAGNGLTATSAVIAVDYGTSANTAAQGNVGVTFAGTTNEIELSTNTFSTIGGGGNVTIGLPNDVTIANDLTVLGDLEVSGTASFKHSENLDIADKFITLSSGSTTATDGGIIVAQAASGTNQVGEGYGFDASVKRWGVTSSLSNNSGAIVPKDYMVTARATDTSGAAPSAAPIFGGSSDGYGNIHVDTSTEEIYIYA
tara:strand:- start:855 stop:2600 length:1746 start_codon:yes stop_codon:yes gene_type:complete